MFPFRGMPGWAQAIGNVLPATYFMRLGARHPAQGQRSRRALAEYLAADGVHRCHDDDRGDLLPQDPRLAMKRDLSCIATVAIAACATDPLRQPEIPVAARYTPTPVAIAGPPQPACTAAARSSFVAGRDIPGEWWTLFQSPALDALVRRALDGSPTLARAQAQAAPGAGRPERAERRYRISARRREAVRQSRGREPAIPGRADPARSPAAQPLSRLGQRVLHLRFRSERRGASWRRCARRSTTRATSSRPRA